MGGQFQFLERFAFHVLKFKGTVPRKSVEIMTKDDRSGLNQGSPTVFKILKSAV
jgi:hypothetical protein